MTATTILTQLGGNRFIAMTGAKNLVGGDNDLTFSLPARLARNGINKIRVALDASDTYTVTAYRYRALNLTQIEAVDGVYCDNLRDVFTSVTGLDCTM
jgi:hypothetical protein